MAESRRASAGQSYGHSEHARSAWPITPNHRLRRRHLLALGALVSAAAPAHAKWAERSIAAAEPLRQVRAGGLSGLLAVGASGALWPLSAKCSAARAMRWRRRPLCCCRWPDRRQALLLPLGRALRTDCLRVGRLKSATRC